MKLDELGFVALNELFQTGDAHVEELSVLKAQAMRSRATLAPTGAKKAKKPIPLREKDPW